METAKPDRALIIRKIPADLRREFKACCAKEGVSQQDKVIELMKKYVEKEKEK